MAGIAVAGVFFVADVVRATPLSTAVFLGRVLLESAGVALQDPAVTEALAGFSAGGRLASLTAVHLLAYGMLGILAVALANLFNIRWSALKGAVLGAAVGSIIGYFAAGLGMYHLSSGLLTVELILAANVVGGVVLGWYLRLCRQEAEEAA
jgi:hypothetical protein